VGYFDGLQTTAAISFLIDLIRRHHVAPSLSQSAAAGVDFFRADRAAMQVGGHWLIVDYLHDGIDFGVVRLPSNIGRPTTVIYESGLAMNQHTRQEALAWSYIKYIASEAVQKVRVADGLAISANAAVAQYYAGNSAPASDVSSNARPRVLREMESV